LILEPFIINKVTLPNRLVVAPMCQYSATNGNPSKWHYAHLQQLATSGAGMLMLESTAINNQGRISLKDLTLTNNRNEKSINTLISYLRTISNIPLGLQISHAGRKGSSQVPWIEANTALNIDQKSWNTVAPSPIKRDSNWPIPKELSVSQINKLICDYEETAIRSKRIGFDALEIHMAHGYLLHQFFSKISNRRKDNYGGNLENRCRILVEIIDKVRDIWPKDKILGARITGNDWLDDGITIEDSIYLVKKLKDHGLDYVCISSGGILQKTKMVFKPGYQVHLAREIKKRTGIITRTAGMITNFNQASAIIESGSADLVALARKFIYDPTWLIHEIKRSNGQIDIPKQYERCF
jgi:2,4-dienoyl-CoA reductase-like NADH-dependent reductase (Old Yellow Enzyme family)